MRDRTLFAKIVGIEEPWCVADVKMDDAAQTVDVHVMRRKKPALLCPECGTRCPGYDTRQRRWRHLDMCQYETTLVARVPRVTCSEHGVRQVKVPWAEDGSRFTALFEALAIDWLREANISAVARRLRASWDEVDGIMSRAVRRGLQRRKTRLPKNITVDETSFQKRHEYVTIIADQDSGAVMHVADGHGREVLDTFYGGFDDAAKGAVQSVAMDMWPAYIASTREHIPDADKKIAFDKFHVAKHLGDAIDKVRRDENRELLAEGDDSLKRTRYLWLKNPVNIDPEKWANFESLRTSVLRTARAWALKETAMTLWDYQTRGWASRAWMKWYSWAIRTRLEPVKRVARMIKSHLYGILNAIVLGITNARAEGINSVVQWLKYSARGFRSRDRFRNAIYFHLGQLDLYPSSVKR